MSNEKTHTFDIFINQKAISALKGVFLFGFLGSLIGIFNAYSFHQFTILIFLCFLLLSFVIAFALYKKRYIFFATMTSVVVSLFILSCISAVGNGIHDSAVLFYPAIIIFSCFILKDSLFIVFSIFGFLLFNISSFVNWNSLIPEVPLHNNSYVEIIFLNLSFIGFGFIGRLLSEGLSDSDEITVDSTSVYDKTTANYTSITVALVEDNAEILFFLKDAFERHGYITRTFDSANSLQTWIESTGSVIDVLVTDFYLNVSDGRMVIEYVRRMFPKIPIILISGYPLDKLALSIDFYKDVVFIPKPFIPQDIIDKIEIMLQK